MLVVMHAAACIHSGCLCCHCCCCCMGAELGGEASPACHCQAQVCLMISVGRLYSGWWLRPLGEPWLLGCSATASVGTGSSGQTDQARVLIVSATLSTSQSSEGRGGAVLNLTFLLLARRHFKTNILLSIYIYIHVVLCI